MSKVTMSAEDKKWQIESDARVIRDFGEISSDTKRFSAAKKYIEDENRKSQALLDAKFWTKLTKSNK